MIRFTELINASLQWTVVVLFRPFRLKKWLLLGFAAFLAGQLAGGANFNLGDFSPNKAKEAKAAVVQAEQQAAPSGKDSDAIDKEELKKYLPIIILVIAIFLIPFMIIMSWLSARFSFIFMEDVVKNDASIRRPFRENKKEGNSLFLFSLLANTLILAVVALDIYLGFLKLNAMGVFQKDSQVGFVPILLACLPYGIILLLILLFSAVLHFIIYDFAVVIMYKDKLKILPAIAVFFGMFRKQKGLFVKYFFVKLGLNICAALAYWLVSLAATIALLIPAIIVGLTLYFLYSALRPLCYIVGFGLVLPAFIFVVYCTMCLYLPFAVFLRTFALKFIGRAEGRYNLFKFS